MDNDKSPHILMTDLISLQQASLESGFSHGHLALLIRRGELRGWKIGRVWVTTRMAIEDYRKLDKKPGPVKKD